MELKRNRCSSLFLYVYAFVVLPLQEEFLSPEFRQLAERCRVMESNVDALADLKTVPGIIYLSVWFSYTVIVLAMHTHTHV